MKHPKTETLINLALWSLLFTVPLSDLYGRNVSNAYTPFDWTWALVIINVSLILAFCAYIGARSDIRRQKDRMYLAGIESQLDYLRSQIHPHFLMNTLNDLQSFVDTNPEKAKDAIWELSQMIHYIYYQGDKQFVHLYNELDLIRHYVRLMQLRYADKVKITLDLPLVPNREIPPLILITFIENAFEYGVGEGQESFVEIKASVEADTLKFICRNSKKDQPIEERTCTNVQNVRKRLNLLYDLEYSLRIEDEPQTYTVEFIITLK